MRNDMQCEVPYSAVYLVLTFTSRTGDSHIVVSVN